MKTSKKLVSVLLVLVLLFIGMQMTAAAEDDDYLVLHEGETVQVGKNLFFAVENNVLTISGSGEIYENSKPMRMDDPEGTNSVYLNDSNDMNLYFFDAIVIGAGVSEWNKEYTRLLETNAYEVAPENAYFSTDENGVLFNKDQTVLLAYPAGSPLTTYSVPETVRTVSDYAFLVAMNLDELIFPEGVTSCNIGGIGTISRIVLPATFQFGFIGGFNYILDEVVIKSMDAAITGNDFFANCSLLQYLEPLSREQRKAVVQAALNYKPLTDDTLRGYLDEVKAYLATENGDVTKWAKKVTICCHAGSTAEAYAMEHQLNYRLSHFFDGEWTCDADSQTCARKCIYCDAIETKPVENEPDAPTTPDEPTVPDEPAVNVCPLCGKTHTHKWVRILHYIIYILISPFRK